MQLWESLDRPIIGVQTITTRRTKKAEIVQKASFAFTGQDAFLLFTAYVIGKYLGIFEPTAPPPPPETPPPTYEPVVVTVPTPYHGPTTVEVPPAVAYEIQRTVAAGGTVDITPRGERIVYAGPTGPSAVPRPTVVVPGPGAQSSTETRGGLRGVVVRSGI